MYSRLSPSDQVHRNHSAAGELLLQLHMCCKISNIGTPQNWFHYQEALVIRTEKKTTMVKRHCHCYCVNTIAIGTVASMHHCVNFNCAEDHWTYVYVALHTYVLWSQSWSSNTWGAGGGLWWGCGILASKAQEDWGRQICTYVNTYMYVCKYVHVCMYRHVPWKGCVHGLLNLSGCVYILCRWVVHFNLCSSLFSATRALLFLAPHTHVPYFQYVLRVSKFCNLANLKHIKIVLLF